MSSAIDVTRAEFQELLDRVNVTSMTADEALSTAKIAHTEADRHRVQLVEQKGDLNLQDGRLTVQKKEIDEQKVQLFKEAERFNELGTKVDASSSAITKFEALYLEDRIAALDKELANLRKDLEEKVVARYLWQDRTSSVSIYTDSDWGGCERTRKSTTGGVVMKGLHCIGQWSRTQQLIALSSAEAELNASVRAGQEGIGIINFSTETGTPHGAEILGDSSAAHGINMRVGSGRVKHLSIRQVWLQERVATGYLTCRKIPREINCADAMTHHWSPKKGKVHFGIMHCYTRGPTSEEISGWTRGGVKADSMNGE